MSKVAIKGADTGTGVFTIESPATNTDRTLTLPDEAGTILTSGGAIDVASGAPADSVAIDASGNLLVGTTGDLSSSLDFASNEGSVLWGDGYTVHSRARATANTGFVLAINRNTSDGELTRFYKDGTAVGSIGSLNGISGAYFGTGSTAIAAYSNAVRPVNGSTGSYVDNTFDIGTPSYRFDDVYATNGTIQTSDAREKENIASLTPAEMAVGKRLSSLFKTFTWVDKTRTHSGIIAQDVKAAFEAEGLDAGKYALFIHAEWTDEETGEQRDRMGIRYPELLSFVAAYNDQRFAAIEARLDALEGGA